MTRALTVYAGEMAFRRLQEKRLEQEDIECVIAASGGPKWFVLYHLNHFLFSEFFAGRQSPLHTLGSSAGAWQLVCLATRDPAKALTRLMDLYSHETYTVKPDVDEITQKAERLIKAVIGDEGAAEVVNNPIIKTHILTNRSKHLLKMENRYLLSLGLGATAMGNLISRRSLRHFFERVLFHSGSQSFFNFSDFQTVKTPLQEENLIPVLLATGAIPLIIRGQSNIPRAPKGLYRDGGIIDYHFDLPFAESEKLILYPHFSARPIAGWFDKPLHWRRVNKENYKRIVMMVPSQEFIDALPFKKITDRNDFVRMDAVTRQRYWQQVIAAGQQLADEFAAYVEGRSDIDLRRFGA